MHTLTNQERLEALISHYASGNKSLFGRMLGLQPSSITNWMRRDTLDFELIYSKCAGLNPHWLLTGEGAMLTEIISNDNKPTYNASDNKPNEAIEALISAMQIQARELGALQYRLEKEEEEHKKTKRTLANTLRGLDEDRLKGAGDVRSKESAHVVYMPTSRPTQKRQHPED